MTRSSLLVRLFGFPALLVHGDPLVVDRWLWLKKHLPKAQGNESLLDVGSGNGAFTIGAARSGYNSIGLSWSEEDQAIASDRAKLLHVSNVSFDVQDVRRLDTRTDLAQRFDVVLCFENIEHILDDAKLMRDVAATLRSGGLLLLTTPSEDYRPIDRNDRGPFSPIEDGGHVRKGYSTDRLAQLCAEAGLQVLGFGSCSGLLSQKLAAFGRLLWRVHPVVAWVGVLPFRPLAPVLDPVFRRFLSWPDYCLCLRAVKAGDGSADSIEGAQRQPATGDARV